MISIKKILIIIFLILVFGFVSATDFYISDLVIPKFAYEDQNIAIEIHLVNTSNSSGNVDLNVDFYSPSGNLKKRDRIQNITIQANSIFVKQHLIVVDSNASNSPHLIRATIITPDDNLSNNIVQKWLIVSKGQRKIPIPDMPIALGLLAGIFVLFFVIKKK